ENKENALVERLVELIHKNNDCLDTGFVSIPYLLDVLCEHGHKELAKTIFFQDQCPSWFYEINHGATTIWESWAGIQPDGKVGTFSFNHYAFGCVLDWIIRETVGLKTCQPGFKSILIQPTVEIVDEFDCSYKTQYGTISIQKKGQQWHIEIPQDIDYNIDLTQVNGYQN
ncbi:MAG: alpha-L-rhamnosidase C-terminal domain-containing protein, partial [Sharpea porci]